VRDNGRVAVPELTPRRTMGTIVAVWVVAAVIGVVIGVLVLPLFRPWRGKRARAGRD